MTPKATEKPDTRDDSSAARRAREARFAELEDIAARGRDLSSGVREIILISDNAGSVSYLNDFAVRYTGVSRDDLTGANWNQTVHPDDSAPIETRRRIERTARREFEYKARLRRHDGAYRWHLVREVPVSSGDEIRSWVTTAVDVHDLVEAERALRESETRFRHLSDVIPQLIWIALPDGRVEFYNSRWYQYTGLSWEEARGTGWEKIIHPDDMEASLTAWRRSSELGVPYTCEQRLRRADGQFRWFLAQALPLTDEGGRIVRWYGTCTDIEDQKRYQDEVARAGERLQIALEAGRMGAWEMDVPSRLMTWTQSLSILYGFDPAVTSGSADELEKYVHPDDMAAGRGIVETAVRERSPFRFEFRIIRSNGTVRWLEARGRIVADAAGGLRAMGVTADITERKDTDRELARRAEELARSNKELEQFAFVASHDLKEPLRKIAGYAELVETRYGDKIDEKGIRFLSHMRDGVRRMDTIIGDLLTYSRAGRAGQAREPVDIAAVVREIADDLETLLLETRAVVDVRDLPTVSANRTQIRQLFQNLISNALKFRGPASPEITISAERAGDAWRFSVKDNGIGIEPQYHERIFELFQRLHTRTEYPGTGIGLAICKKIVESHGGRIWVESRPGAGTDFRFTLPAD